MDEINEVLDEYGIQMPILFSELGSKTGMVERLGLKIDLWLDDDIVSAVRGH